MTAAPKLVQRKEPQTEATVVPELEFILARFRLLAQRHGLWLRSLWQSEGGTAAAVPVAHREFNLLVRDGQSPEAEKEWIGSDDGARQIPRELERLERALTQQTESRWSKLLQVFDLNAQESDLLQACLAISLDPSLGRVCAYLHDHHSRSYMSETLAARMYGHGRCGVWGSESGLFRWELIRVTELSPGEPAALTCDPYIRNWLLGKVELDDVLAPMARLIPFQEPPPSWPVRQLISFLHDVLTSQTPDRVHVAITGVPGSGRRTLAACVAAGVGLPLLLIDANKASEASWRSVVVHAQRHAFLERCALAWSCSSGERAWPTFVQNFPLQFSISEPGQSPPAIPNAISRNVSMPQVSSKERLTMWKKLVPTARTWKEKELTRLTNRYRSTVGEIAAAARRRPANARDAALAVRTVSRPKLGSLVRRLPCPFRWQDLVVSPSVREVLQQVAFEAAHRGEFWEQPSARRMFPLGRGLMVLLSGAPGTGKTMSAQVIARELCYDLLRIDLSAVVSKWVGETSQNLDKLLRVAARSNAVLLFDEADALFSKRVTEIRDAQDKFANTDAAHLLQAIESFPGVALLSTNQKSNIDPAFIRRLRYLVEFSKPGPQERLAIWKKVCLGLLGEAVTEHVAETLRFMSDIELTGAQIKFSVLSAVFVAEHERKPLSGSSLVRGVQWELAKEGRGLSARDRERLLHV
jgi:hypothetical protein